MYSLLWDENQHLMAQKHILCWVSNYTFKSSPLRKATSAYTVYTYYSSKWITYLTAQYCTYNIDNVLASQILLYIFLSDIENYPANVMYNTEIMTNFRLNYMLVCNGSNYGLNKLPACNQAQGSPHTTQGRIYQLKRSVMDTEVSKYEIKVSRILSRPWLHSLRIFTKFMCTFARQRSWQIIFILGFVATI